MKKSLFDGSTIRSILSILLLLASFFGKAQQEHPHILVKPSDKALILQKIQEQDWARQVYMEMTNRVKPYVIRHQEDPEWILSRYLMNRIPGKRYTEFFSDRDGTALVRYAGDAPYPTVRVAPHKRPPVSKDGEGYKMPNLEELVPYDTSMLMLLERNDGSGKKEWVDPQTFVDNINGKINKLALQAAIVYWLTGEKAYARFAADILSQWARGAYHQSPITGPCRTGFLSIQTLGDGSYEPMPLTYDFVYDYLQQNKYEMSWYEPVFNKMANTMTFRGFWNNNWFAAQKPALVFSALALENKKLGEYYLDFYMNRDTINGGCGHLSMPSLVEKWLTPDGHWKEPGGYHNYPVSSTLISAIAMEKNGYPVFKKYPALLDASYVMLKYSFPNLIAPSIGDTGPASQSAECLEIGLIMAQKYKHPIEKQLSAALKVLMEQKGYKRSAADYLGLLCYLPEVVPSNDVAYTWPRSGVLDFAKCYLQRNGTDKEHGLMYVVQGASYNHNHANGMSMELYGAGTVMGPDPGKGITYEAPLHVNYYAQWAAHNTVIAGGISSAVPKFRGGGGTKQMGEISLKSMEPMPEQPAVSPQCSFTDTRYTDKATGSAQQRTMGIIRTGASTGYYIDIFRSDNAVSNEYLYHNIGHGLGLLNQERKPISITPTAYPINKKAMDPPGLGAIQAVRTTGTYAGGLVALFKIEEKQKENKFMQVLFTGQQGRSFYTGEAPETKTADPSYRKLKTPTLIVRQEGEAWKRPFVAVFEPFTGNNKHSIERIHQADISDPANFTALHVRHVNQSAQLVFQSIQPERTYTQQQWKFKGDFGVVDLQGEQIKYLYLGSGKELHYGPYSIVAVNIKGAAQIEVAGEHKLTISANQPTNIIVRDTQYTGARLLHAKKILHLKTTKTAEGIECLVPAINNATLVLQANSDKDLETIRARIVQDLLAPGIQASAIQSYVNTIQKDGSWKDINYIDTSKTAFQHRVHLERMNELARALKKTNSPFYGDLKVKNTVLSALDFWLEKDFICENWWWNEMGTPSSMINLLLVLDTSVSAIQSERAMKIAGRANLNAFGARPGGDLIQIAGMYGKQGLYKRDPAILELVVQTMASEIKVSDGRGMQADMSFHHRTDGVISTLTYGTGYASTFTYWAQKIAGTRFSIPEEKTKLLTDYYLDGISKSMVFGKFPDLGSKNRGLSREGALKPMADNMTKGLLAVSMYRKAELENLHLSKEGNISPNLNWNRFFWKSAYFTHQKPRWFSSVRMHSSRQNNVEFPYNEEGLRNHHLTDGSNFISLTGKEYLDIFPVWDWQKIPGTTVLQKPSLPHWNQIVKKGVSSFVGGVSDGIYGAAAMDFISPHDPLRAKKSWFFFKDEYVCLGAGINSVGALPVVTTLNQTLLNGEVRVNSAEGSSMLKKGNHLLNEVTSIGHGGVTYLLHQPQTIHISNTTATGNWRLITHQDWATEKPIEKEVFTAWIDHGTAPKNQSYAYTVLPLLDEELYQKDNPIEVLSNSSILQAVRHKEMNLIQAVCYAAGRIQLDKTHFIDVEAPCMVMVQMKENVIHSIAVADPSQLLTSLKLRTNSKLMVEQKGIETNWDEKNATTTLEIQLPQKLESGKTVMLMNKQ